MAVLNKILLRARKQKIGLTHEQKYVTRAVRYSTITAAGLAYRISQNSGVAEAQANAVITALFKEMEQCVMNGHSIQVGTLGNLCLRIKCPAVDTPEEVSADNVYRVTIGFKPSSEAKNKLKAISFDTDIIKSE